ncbi:MAG: flippase [Candidatus Binatia bacterium]
MAEARKIFRNTLVLTLARLTESVSSILLVFLISRKLGVTGLGVYSATLAYYGLIALAAEFGTTNFLVREIAKDRSVTSRYLVHLGGIGALAGVFATTVAVPLIPLLGYSAELTTCVYIILLAIVPGTLNTMQEAVFVAHQRVELQTYTTFLAALLSFSLSLYLLMQDYGVVSLVVTFVLIRYVITVCYLFLTHIYIAPLRWEFHLSFARTLVSEIKAFAASSLLAGLFMRPEIILLSLFATELQTGYYSAALKLVDLWYLLPATYMVNVFPVLSRSYHVTDDKAQEIQERSVKYLLALSFPVAVGLTVAATPIVQLFYGPEFAPAITILQILAWNVPLYCLNSVLWRVLVARGQQDLNVRVQSITAVTRLTAGGMLIAAFGALGAAITAVANLFLHNRLLAFYLKRDGVRLPTWRLTWRFALAASIMGVMVLACREHVHLGVLVPLAATLYVVLIVVCRAISAEELAFFRRLISLSVREKQASQPV